MGGLVTDVFSVTDMVTASGGVLGALAVLALTFGLGPQIASRTIDAVRAVVREGELRRGKHSWKGKHDSYWDGY